MILINIYVEVVCFLSNSTTDNSKSQEGIYN
jgi:hypothetical protein